MAVPRLGHSGQPYCHLLAHPAGGTLRKMGYIEWLWITFRPQHLIADACATINLLVVLIPGHMSNKALTVMLEPWSKIVNFRRAGPYPRVETARDTNRWDGSFKSRQADRKTWIPTPYSSELATDITSLCIFMWYVHSYIYRKENMCTTTFNILWTLSFS